MCLFVILFFKKGRNSSSKSDKSIFVNQTLESTKYIINELSIFFISDRIDKKELNYTIFCTKSINLKGQTTASSTKENNIEKKVQNLQPHMSQIRGKTDSIKNNTHHTEKIATSISNSNQIPLNSINQPSISIFNKNESIALNQTKEEQLQLNDIQMVTSQIGGHTQDVNTITDSDLNQITINSTRMPTLNPLSPANTGPLLRQDLPSSITNTPLTLRINSQSKQIIRRQIIMNWLNIFSFLVLESARVIFTFDYKITIEILILFDLLEILTNFQKHKMNQQVDEDEYETEAEIESRSELNQQIYLSCIELLSFIIFKVFIILRLEYARYLDLAIIAGTVFIIELIQIYLQMRFQKKYYNPIFNEKLILMFKMFVSFQSFLIAMWFEEYIRWSWVEILSPTFLFLGLQGLIDVGFIGIIIWKFWKQFSDPTAVQKHEFIGISWLFLQHTCLTVSSFLLALGFINDNDNIKIDYSYSAFISLLTFLWLLILQTMIYWENINKYIYDIQINHELEDEEEDIEYIMTEDAMQIKAKKEKSRERRIKTINPNEREQESQSFIVGKQATLEDIQEIQLKKKHFEDGPNSKLKEDPINPSPNNNQWKQIAIDTNQKFEKLKESPFANIGYQQQIDANLVKKRLFFTPRISPRGSCSIQEIVQTQLPVSNLDQRELKSNDQTNTACVICFDNSPDSVYMPCGHGGVCYECSIDVLKKTGECYLCREVIKEILRLNIVEKNDDNNFRVVAMTTMVDESIIEDNSKKHSDLLNQIQEETQDEPQKSDI